MADKKIDRASDIEFAQAIADSLPYQDKKIFAKVGTGILLGSLIKLVRQK